MSRGGNAFCYAEHIDANAAKLFRTLDQDVFAGSAKRANFIDAASEFLGELNAIHCFRDGNGRAQITFLHLVADRACHPMQLARVKRKTFLPAMIASFHSDLGPLRKELAKLCRKERRR